MLGLRLNRVSKRGPRSFVTDPDSGTIPQAPVKLPTQIRFDSL